MVTAVVIGLAMAVFAADRWRRGPHGEHEPRAVRLQLPSPPAVVKPPCSCAQDDDFPKPLWVTTIGSARGWWRCSRCGLELKRHRGIIMMPVPGSGVRRSG